MISNCLPAIFTWVSNKYFTFNIRHSLRQHPVHYWWHLTCVSKIHSLSRICLSELLDSFHLSPYVFPPYVSISVPGHNPQASFYCFVFIPLTPFTVLTFLKILFRALFFYFRNKCSDCLWNAIPCCWFLWYVSRLKNVSEDTVTKIYRWEE